MSVRMVLHVFKKPGMAFEDFRKHYEEVHIPLMKDLGGSLFPVAHIRRYIIPSDPASDGSVTQQLSGAPGSFVFDALAELVFRDMEHFGTFSALLQTEENQMTVADDCAKFMDTGMTATLLFKDGEVVETKSVY